MSELERKTVVITGGSCGIGQAIALRYATAKADLIILTKDTPENIKQTEDQIIAAGGQTLVFNVDISDLLAIKQAISEGVKRFGSVDILVNNTSAPVFSDSFHTTPEQFDLVLATSVRAAFFLSQFCFPHLKEAKNPHIINISPPLLLEEQWLGDYLPFSLGKYGMSLCTLGMAASFRRFGIAVNSLWPQTNIATQRLKDHLSPQVYAGSRWPSIVADAVYELSLRTSLKATGQFFIDEALLQEAGVTDFSHYAVDPTQPLVQTLFLPLKEGMIPISRELFLF